MTPAALFAWMMLGGLVAAGVVSVIADLIDIYKELKK